MGQTITTGNNQPKTDKKIKNAYPPISLYPHIWIILFQPHTVSPTWDTSGHKPHGEDDGYIGPSMEHYICHKACITRKKADSISDTVVFSPKQFNMRNMSSIDATFNAAHDLIYALYNPALENHYPN